jgi:hypothetical protein
MLWLICILLICLNLIFEILYQPTLILILEIKINLKHTMKICGIPWFIPWFLGKNGGIPWYFLSGGTQLYCLLYRGEYRPDSSVRRVVEWYSKGPRLEFRSGCTFFSPCDNSQNAAILSAWVTLFSDVIESHDLVGSLINCKV